MHFFLYSCQFYRNAQHLDDLIIEPFIFSLFKAAMALWVWSQGWSVTLRSQPPQSGNGVVTERSPLSGAPQGLASKHQDVRGQQPTVT